MGKTWILVANAHRARCFERHAPDSTLTEKADFVHPRRRNTSEAKAGDRTGTSGKGHGRSIDGGTPSEPCDDSNAEERSRFARQLANYLNEGVAGHGCTGLVLIASSPMLGELKPGLSPAAGKVLRNCVAADWSRHQGAELKQHIDHALRLPD